MDRLLAQIIHVILSVVKNLAFEESSGQILHYAQNDSVRLIWTCQE